MLPNPRDANMEDIGFYRGVRNALLITLIPVVVFTFPWWLPWMRYPFVYGLLTVAKWLLEFAVLISGDGGGANATLG